MNTRICPICLQEFEIKWAKSPKTCCSTACSNTNRARKIPRPPCSFCSKPVFRSLKHLIGIEKFCDKQCEAEYRKQRTAKKCEICGTGFEVTPSNLARKFCSRKCMGVRNKTTMITQKPQWRSFGECALVVLFKKNFPELIVHTNNRKILAGYELDIFFPSLQAAIEFNGPHHFKPVYGLEVFEKTTRRDAEKRLRADVKGIRIVDINCMKSISKTTKTLVANLFKEACQALSLTPTRFDFSVEEVLTEKTK